MWLVFIQKEMRRDVPGPVYRKPWVLRCFGRGIWSSGLPKDELQERTTDLQDHSGQGESDTKVGEEHDPKTGIDLYGSSD